MSNVSPDLLYYKRREDLLAWEDIRLNYLLQAMCNFYTTKNDQSIWGNFLRALASELGRLDYYYAYDVVGKNPKYLTPPDVLRRWGSPLYLNSYWPTKDQFDQDFKDMLLALIQAYHQGSTISGIQSVITAYTGINIVVEELYKEIGNGIYDQSDRNTLKVSIRTGSDSLSEITTLTQLQGVVESLYGAVDLAKPAHVGLNFQVVFDEGNDVRCYISPAYVTQEQYSDLSSDIQAFYSLVDYVLINPVVSWQPTGTTMFAQYTIIKDNNGNLQVATNKGFTGSSVPTWSVVSGGTTVDNQITWLNISPAVTGLSLVSGVLTVVVDNNFYAGQSVSLLNLVGDYSFLNEVSLTVVSSTPTGFTANYVHVDVATESQSQGTVSYLPSASVDIITYSTLSSVLQNLYQANLADINCQSDGINDSLRIFVRIVEDVPQLPMLIMAPVQNTMNTPTKTAAWGLQMAPILTASQYTALPSISFNVVNTVIENSLVGFTFTSLSGGTSSVDLHEGMEVSMSINSVTLLAHVINFTGSIKNVVMITSTSGTFEMDLPYGLVGETIGTGTVFPTLQSAYVFSGGQYTILQDALLPPLSNSMLNPPIQWIQLVDKDTSMPTGEVGNWDKSHPAGLVAPRMSPWEIRNDQDFTFSMS